MGTKRPLMTTPQPMPTRPGEVASQANQTLANWFWVQVGGPSQFPRDMARSGPRALPLAIVLLPKLSSDGVAAWLADRNVPAHHLPAGLRLQGLLIARGGTGIAFIDASQPEEEVRFSIAHEIAHFLLHHLIPRQMLVKAVGPGIQAVLDGQRAPTTQERLSASLAGVTFGTFTHLDTDRECRRLAGTEAQREIEADLLAFELLAPRRELSPVAGQEESTITHKSVM
jgi:hypothetical protein